MFMPNKPWHRVSSGDWKMAQELAAMGTEMPKKHSRFPVRRWKNTVSLWGGFFWKKWGRNCIHLKHSASRENSRTYLQHNIIWKHWFPFVVKVDIKASDKAFSTSPASFSWRWWKLNLGPSLSKLLPPPLSYECCMLKSMQRENNNPEAWGISQENSLREKHSPAHHHLPEKGQNHSKDSHNSLPTTSQKHRCKQHRVRFGSEQRDSGSSS